MDIKNSRLNIFLIITGIILLLSCGVYLYQRHVTDALKSPVGTTINCNSDNMSFVADKWLEQYIKQYKKISILREKRVKSYEVADILVLEENVVQINFTLNIAKPNEKTATDWNGVLENNVITCQWVTYFQKFMENNETIYKVTDVIRPAAYDLEKYNSSVQKDIDGYNMEYVAEQPYEKTQYTYKIEDNVCYVSYDTGVTWKKVPVDVQSLCEVGDGNSYYNKLADRSYLITPEKTAIVYGGTGKNNLTMVYSDDMGNTWMSSQITDDIDSNRVKFCSFPTKDIGYVVASSGRAMSQEEQTIYVTKNGGKTWEVVGMAPSTWLLYMAGFVDENVGFFSYISVDGEKTNFYKTKDGGKTFEEITLPKTEVTQNGITLTPFKQPEIPYLESGKLYLTVRQGSDGDYKGGKVSGRYVSDDMGNTWIFLEEIA